jgi:hypothetical protein
MRHPVFAVVLSRSSPRRLLTFVTGVSVCLADATFGNLAAFLVGALPVQSSPAA